MIVCPNCDHQNPDGAVQCEACYAPLPEKANCPKCGAAVQGNATFCGQCGFNLKTNHEEQAEESTSTTTNLSVGLQELDPEPAEPPQAQTLVSQTEPDLALEETQNPETVSSPLPEENLEPTPSSSPLSSSTALSVSIPATELQLQKASLLHLQTNTIIELPQSLDVIHIGKSNDRIPPDLDISGLPDSDIVSRVHADIRVEEDIYYLEDVGSTNGTYINHALLMPGNLHRLRPGDHIALGKGDKVSFIFQLSG